MKMTTMAIMMMKMMKIATFDYDNGDSVKNEGMQYYVNYIIIDLPRALRRDHSDIITVQFRLCKYVADKVKQHSLYTASSFVISNT